MKLRELIRSCAPITVRDDDTIAQALRAMLWSQVRHLPVVRDGEVVGVVSERDLLMHQVRYGRRGRHDLVGTMMSKPAVVASPDLDAADAAVILLDRKLGCLPVVDRGALVGVVSRSDFLSCWASSSLPA